MSLENVSKYIISLKKKMIGESAAHVYISCILTLFMIMVGIYWPLAVTITIIINMAGEVVLPSADINDVLFGGLGASIAALLYFISLLF